MATFTKRIDATIRDVGYIGTFPDQNSALSLGNPGAVVREIALRFTGVTIPQGATINSAKITFRSTDTKSGLNIVMKIEGVDEDNTAEFTISPENTAKNRTHTTANAGWNISGQTSGTDIDTSNIGSIVQEIVDRAGWASGNAMGFWISDNGSSSGDYIDVHEYGTSTTLCALLTIDYVEPGSPSPSPTPSPSPSASPSLSPSRSPSATPSPSASISPSPSASEPFFGMKIAKPGYDVLITQDPSKLIFSSDYGTLKYFEKLSVVASLDADAGEIGCHETLNHNLGYYPYVEVFVRVYIGSPSGNYEYCPFFGAGATVFYSANYKITENTIEVYGQIDGISSEVWNFDFLVFIFKNNLNL